MKSVFHGGIPAGVGNKQARSAAERPTLPPMPTF
jgi:hypothetical protein